MWDEQLRHERCHQGLLLCLPAIVQERGCGCEFELGKTGQPLDGWKLAISAEVLYPQRVIEAVRTHGIQILRGLNAPQYLIKQQ